jgi:hypothetical protein
MADETRDGERDTHTHARTHTHTSRKLAMEHSEQQKREEMMMMLLTKPVEEDPIEDDRQQQMIEQQLCFVDFVGHPRSKLSDNTCFANFLEPWTDQQIDIDIDMAVGTGAFDGRERRIRRFAY